MSGSPAERANANLDVGASTAAGGEVSAASVVGQGSMFTLTLPRRALQPS